MDTGQVLGHHSTPSSCLSNPSFASTSTFLIYEGRVEMFISGQQEEAEEAFKRSFVLRLKFEFKLQFNRN